MEDDPVFEKARQKALRLLSLRGRSVHEIQRKLLEGGYDRQVVRRVVAGLKKLRYLDDAAFARDWAHHLAANRHYGDRRIRAGLIEKGIARELIEEAIAGVRKDCPEEEVLGAVVRKKLKNRAPRDLDRREKQKLGRSLLAKGFSPGLIYDFLRIEEGSFDERE